MYLSPERLKEFALALEKESVAVPPDINVLSLDPTYIEGISMLACLLSKAPSAFSLSITQSELDAVTLASIATCCTCSTGEILTGALPSPDPNPTLRQTHLGLGLRELFISECPMPDEPIPVTATVLGLGPLGGAATTRRSNPLCVRLAPVLGPGSRLEVVRLPSCQIGPAGAAALARGILGQMGDREHDDGGDRQHVSTGPSAVSTCGHVSRHD